MNKIIQGDCIEELKKLPDNSVDAIITDPPYGIGFMGKEWDNFKPEQLKEKTKDWKQGDHKQQTGRSASMHSGSYDLSQSANYKFQLWFSEVAKECLRVLNPGGYLLSFGGTRTYHRMTCGIEDAGFEIRDCIMWIYGSGFPKSLNIGKQIDKQDTKEFREEIGNIIKEARDKKGLTMDRLCDILNLNNEGHGGMVNHYENGRATPTIELWNKICEVLEITKEDYDKQKKGRLETIGKKITNLTVMQRIGRDNISGEVDIKIPTTPEAKQWEGWGTALKPAVEPIVVARKPLSEKNVALNVLKWGTGGINIDESRIEYKSEKDYEDVTFGNNSGLIKKDKAIYGDFSMYPHEENIKANIQGRFPANIILDEESAELLGEPSRFFYVAKASKSERNFGCDEIENSTTDDGREVVSDRPHQRGATQRKNNHPTVKPIKLMEYLIKLVSKENSIILDPFLGSGTTAIACIKTNRQFIGIEKEADYIKIAEARIKPHLEQTKLQ